MSRSVLVCISIFIILIAFLKQDISLLIRNSKVMKIGSESESNIQLNQLSRSERELDSGLKSRPLMTQTDPAKPSTEELGLFLESHGLPRILAKEAWVYGKTIQAVLKTGNNPRSGDLATDQALTSWSNICVMRLTRKYRMEPQVIRHFFAVVQSNNPALKP